MSNKLIIAAAGSGKTTHLINEAIKITSQKVLITTYTEANEAEIKKKFYEVNGCIPPNITVQTWFSFLIQHGVKPYQSVIYNGDITGLQLVNQKSGVKYYIGKRPIYYGEDEAEKHYFSKAGRIYSDKLSKFVVKANMVTNGLVIDRISRIYDNVFIDEIQDMAGYDLDIIKLLFNSRANVLMVGDPRQVTYHTHDEAKYKKYSEGNVEEFINEECSGLDVEIDKKALNTTFRNNKRICEFANSIYPNFEPCSCANNEKTSHDGVFFISSNCVNRYLQTFNPIQLRDKATVPVNMQYPVMNFGESKGITFDRVLVYPTKPMLSWMLDNNTELKNQSRARLYVAVTRAKYSVAIVVDNLEKYDVVGIEKFVFSEANYND